MDDEGLSCLLAFTSICKLKVVLRKYSSVWKTRDELSGLFNVEWILAKLAVHIQILVREAKNSEESTLTCVLRRDGFKCASFTAGRRKGFSQLSLDSGGLAARMVVNCTLPTLESIPSRETSRKGSRMQVALEKNS